VDTNHPHTLTSTVCWDSLTSHEQMGKLLSVKPVTLCSRKACYEAWTC